MAARAATAGGHLCLGDDTPALLTAVTDALFSTSSSRTEAVHFAAGEALCCVFGGVRSLYALRHVKHLGNPSFLFM